MARLPIHQNLIVSLARSNRLIGTVNHQFFVRLKVLQGFVQNSFRELPTAQIGSERIVSEAEQDTVVVAKKL